MTESASTILRMDNVLVETIGRVLMLDIGIICIDHLLRKHKNSLGNYNNLSSLC